jgi:hypothetical protein
MLWGAMARPPGFLVLLAALASGCTCGEPETAPETAPGPEPARPTDTEESDNPLYVPPSSYDFAANRPLLERIRESPHGYFRFINVAFSEQVCERFRGQLTEMPTVNLHGDAHLEQYVVTNFGRGLSDYDDSSTGPSVIDLVRLGTSLHLACRACSLEAEERTLMREILRGYRAALDDPELEAPEPSVARRIRETFTTDRSEFIRWVEEVMVPLPPAERARFEEAGREYRQTMIEQHPELPPSFFTMKAMGTHALGIGSALDEKYLVRIEGPTSAPEDDVILEAKEVRDLRGISCIRGTENLDPFRILVGQARIAYQPYPYLGHARFEGKSYWIHGWADSYHEVLLSEIDSAEAMREIAYDIGVQLGRGHVKQIAAPLDAQLRRAQRTFLDANETALEQAVLDLGARVIDAWERFVRESEPLARELAAQQESQEE